MITNLKTYPSGFQGVTAYIQWKKDLEKELTERLKTVEYLSIDENRARNDIILELLGYNHYQDAENALKRILSEK